MKKSLNKIRIKALKPIFTTRSEFDRLSKIVNLDRDAVIEVYKSFSSDTKAKLESLFDFCSRLQDRIDYQRHIIDRSRIIFSVISLLLSVSFLFSLI